MVARPDRGAEEAADPVTAGGPGKPSDLGALAAAVAADANAQPRLDPRRLVEFRERLEADQHFGLGLAAGLVAAVLAAAIWAAITVATKFQIGFMAIGVGLLVGVAVRTAGRGLTTAFGMLGAALALLGCVLGNLLSGCGFVALEYDVPFFTVLSSLDADLVVEILKVSFSPMDLLFYAIAAYEGYRLSFRRITEADMADLAA